MTTVISVSSPRVSSLFPLIAAVAVAFAATGWAGAAWLSEPEQSTSVLGAEKPFVVPSGAATTTVPARTVVEAGVPCAPGPESRDCWTEALTAQLEAVGPVGMVASFTAWASTDTDLAGTCHEWNHVMGRLAVANDDDLDAVLVADPHTCQYGYLHGALEEFAGTVTLAALTATLERTCLSYLPDADTTSAERTDLGECFHAAGHAASIAVDDDVAAAVNVCDIFASPAFIVDPSAGGDTIYGPHPELVCAGGVLMEYANSYAASLGAVQVGSGMGPGLAKIDAATAENICEVVADDYRYECLLRSSSFWGPSYGADLGGLGARCAGLGGNDAVACARSVGEWVQRQVFAAAGFPTVEAQGQRIEVLCAQAAATALFDEFVTNCYVGAVRPIVLAQLWAGTKPEEMAPMCPSMSSSSNATLCAEQFDHAVTQYDLAASRAGN